MLKFTPTGGPTVCLKDIKEGEVFTDNPTSKMPGAWDWYMRIKPEPASSKYNAVNLAGGYLVTRDLKTMVCRGDVRV